MTSILSSSSRPGAGVDQSTKDHKLIFGENNNKSWPIVQAKIVPTYEETMQGFTPVRLLSLRFDFTLGVFLSINSRKVLIKVYCFFCFRTEMIRAPDSNSITIFSSSQKTSRNFARRYPIELILFFRDRVIDARHFGQFFFEKIIIFR